MAIDGRIKALQARHKELDEIIQDMENSPSTCSLAIQEKKRKKLKVKDELHRLSG